MSVYCTCVVHIIIQCAKTVISIVFKERIREIRRESDRERERERETESVCERERERER